MKVDTEYEVLGQNHYSGKGIDNTGVSMLGVNTGYGVPETTPLSAGSLSEEMRNNLRVQKARQFGRKKEEVGF